LNATRLILIAGVSATLVLDPSQVSAQPAPRFLHSTSSTDGAHPCGGLVLSRKTLFGTTSGGSGGYWGQGTVFRVGTDGRDFAVLHRFTPLSGATQPTNTDGAYPAAGLVLSNRALYGTAPEGGNAGCGTIFKVNTDGTGFAVLHHFTAGGSNDRDASFMRVAPPPGTGTSVSENSLSGHRSLTALR
jgi:uncharacterized repeat protein (TIGR03803 family)